MLIVPGESQPYQRVADRITTAKGNELERDFAPTLERDGHVLLVDDPRNISETDLMALQERLSKRGPVDGGFSLVTGRTADEAAALYERGDRYSGDVVAIQQSIPSEQRFDDDVTLMTGSEVSAASIAEYGADGAHSLTLHSNGWPIHLNLSEGFLCGFPSNAKEWDFTGAQPYCVDDSEMDCPLSERVVKGDTLSFDHVFVESCSTAIANSTSGLPVHIVLALLSGANTLIGAYRPGPTTVQEIVLYHSLLKAGYSLVECCYLLNENATGNEIMSHPYVPFGHPDTRSLRAEEPTYDVTVKGTVLELTDAYGHVIDVLLDRDELPDADRYYVEDHRDVDEPLYYTTFEEGEYVRILLYAGRRFDGGSIIVEIHASPPAADRMDTLAHALAESRRTQGMNLASDGFETRFDNLRHQVRALGHKTSPATYDAAAYATAAAEIERPFGNVDAMEAELASYAAEGEYIYYKYGAVAIDDRAYHVEDTCHVCDRPLFVKTVSDTCGDARRAIGNCPQCGHVFDVPVTGCKPAPTYPVVSGDLGMDGDAIRELEVRFTNPLDVPMQARFVPSVLKIGDRRGEYDLFDPTSKRRTLTPGETACVTFELDTRLLYENQHFVLGRVVGNLRLYSGRSILFVGDQTGHLRPNQR